MDNFDLDRVAFDTAKLLECIGYPQDRELMCYNTSGKLSTVQFVKGSQKVAVAPHLWDAMKWLREKKGISIMIGLPDWGEGHLQTYKGMIIRQGYAKSDKWITDDYETYEAACDACISVACKILAAHVTNKASKN